MDLIIAVGYVLSVYILLPLYFFGVWERKEGRRDPLRERGIATIRRELARRELGLIDTNGDDRNDLRDGAVGDVGRDEGR